MDDSDSGLQFLRFPRPAGDNQDAGLARDNCRHVCNSNDISKITTRPARDNCRHACNSKEIARKTTRTALRARTLDQPRTTAVTLAIPKEIGRTTNCSGQDAGPARDNRRHACNSKEIGRKTPRTVLRARTPDRPGTTAVTLTIARNLPGKQQKPLCGPGRRTSQGQLPSRLQFQRHCTENNTVRRHRPGRQ